MNTLADDWNAAIEAKCRAAKQALLAMQLEREARENADTSCRDQQSASASSRAAGKRGSEMDDMVTPVVVKITVEGGCMTVCGLASGTVMLVPGDTLTVTEKEARGLRVVFTDNGAGEL